MKDKIYHKYFINRLNQVIRQVKNIRTEQILSFSVYAKCLNKHIAECALSELQMEFQSKNKETAMVNDGNGNQILKVYGV